MTKKKKCCTINRFFLFFCPSITTNEIDISISIIILCIFWNFVNLRNFLYMSIAENKFETSSTSRVSINHLSLYIACNNQMSHRIYSVYNFAIKRTSDREIYMIILFFSFIVISFFFFYQYISLFYFFFFLNDHLFLIQRLTSCIWIIINSYNILNSYKFI